MRRRATRTSRSPIAGRRGRRPEAVAEVVEYGEGLPHAHFDYAPVPAENVGEIQMLVLRIKASRRRHVEAVHDVGAALLRAKQLLGHGNFLPWLQAEFRWSERTANNYMSIARFFKGKTANFADLDIGAAAALAAKSTPPEVRDELLERAEAGENITREEIKERIAASKKARKQAAGLEADGETPAETTQAPPVQVLAPAPPSDFVWAPREPAPIYAASNFADRPAPATDEARARALIEAMLTMERVCVGTPAAVATELLITADPQELSRAQRVMDFIVEIKLALDGQGAPTRSRRFCPRPDRRQPRSVRHGASPATSTAS